MRICFLNPWFEPYPGGIERRLLMVASGLAARGHEVHVVCALLAGTARKEQIHGVHVTRLTTVFCGRYRPPFAFTGVRRLRRAIQRIDPDVVDLHYRWAPDYIATALLERRQRPCVLTYHNGHGEGAGWMRPLSQLNDRILDTFIRRFSAVVVVSEHVRADLDRRVRGLRPTTIYNGVEHPSIESSPTISHQKYLLFVGRLVPTKGLGELIAAVAICRGKLGISDMRLRIVGLGPEYRRLRRMAERLGLGEYVDFLGYVPDAEKDALMVGCRVFCMPSHNESFGMAAVEAMALRRPIVASSVEGLPEAVGGGGILVPPRAPRDLARALACLWNDEAARRSYGAAGFAHAQRYSWNRTVSETERLFQGLCATRSPDSRLAIRAAGRGWLGESRGAPPAERQKSRHENQGRRQTGDLPQNSHPSEGA